MSKQLEVLKYTAHESSSTSLSSSLFAEGVSTHLLT